MKKMFFFSGIAAAIGVAGYILYQRTKKSDTSTTGMGAQLTNGTLPDATLPDVTQPIVTQPDVTQPDVTQPIVTQPDVTQPSRIMLHPDGIVGTKPDNPDVFVLSFAGSNRPANGQSYKKYKWVFISGAPAKYNGLYTVRSGWFLIDGLGRLGNIVVNGVRTGDFSGKFTATLS
jgi:hypothetical protein